MHDAADRVIYRVNGTPLSLLPQQSPIHVVEMLTTTGLNQAFRRATGAAGPERPGCR